MDFILTAHDVQFEPVLRVGPSPGATDDGNGLGVKVARDCPAFS
ncbi:hypothetical protein [Modestobacter sp. KNN46-3]|jgi:hypothetical protein|nr:hypothetical protein [Modestobacter sp. KNN46-3]